MCVYERGPMCLVLQARSFHQCFSGRSSHRTAFANTLSEYSSKPQRGGPSGLAPPAQHAAQPQAAAAAGPTCGAQDVHRRAAEARKYVPGAGAAHAQRGHPWMPPTPDPANPFLAAGPTAPPAGLPPSDPNQPAHGPCTHHPHRPYTAGPWDPTFFRPRSSASQVSVGSVCCSARLKKSGGA
jgi:hypothetical protein